MWVLAAAVLWGSTGTAASVLPTTVHPSTIGGLRLLIAAAVLLVIVRPPVPGRTQWKPVVLAGLAMALYQPAFFSGIRTNGVTLGTLITLGSAPVLAAALDALFTRQRPSWTWFVSTLLALLGLVALLQPQAAAPLSTGGIAASVSAGLAYASFIHAARYANQQGLTAPQTVTLAFIIAAVLLAPWLVTRPVHGLESPGALAAILYLGLVATALAYHFFARGVTQTPPPITATLSLAEPLTASTLAFVLLSERLTSGGLVGASLLLVALLVLLFDQIRPPDSSAPHCPSAVLEEER